MDRHNIDLHTHSNKSDGELTPSQLVFEAKKAGVSTIALCDHDTTSGIDEFLKAGCEAGIKCIPSIEFSSGSDGKIHILGHGIDRSSKGIKDMCKVQQEWRVKRNELVFKYLDEQGIHITVDDIVGKVTQQESFGRPHFALAMMNKGYATSVKDAFDRYLATEAVEKICAHPLTVSDVVKEITNAGGMAVIAHPGLLKRSNEELMDIIEEAIKCGLKGIECFYSGHTIEQTEKFLKIAKELGLCASAGSDYHGKHIKPKIILGGYHLYGHSLDEVNIVDNL